MKSLASSGPKTKLFSYTQTHIKSVAIPWGVDKSPNSPDSNAQYIYVTSSCVPGHPQAYTQTHTHTSFHSHTHTNTLTQIHYVVVEKWPMWPKVYSTRKGPCRRYKRSSPSSYWMVPEECASWSQNTYVCVCVRDTNARTKKQTKKPER